MPGAAPAPAGAGAERRASPAIVAGVLLYLLFAPGIFLLGPFAALLAVTRPRSGREWLWLLVAAAWCVAWLRPSGDLAEQTFRAAGVLVTGAFAGLTLWRAEPAFRRAWQAAALAGLALAVWGAVLELPWSELRQDAERHLRTQFQQQLTLSEGMRQRMGGLVTDELLGVLRRFSLDSGPLADLLPAWLLLAAVTGSLLAWGWYRRVAVAPLGPPPRRFRDFTFSDHAVWLLVAAVASWILAVPGLPRWVGPNLLLVAGVLYTARGLAVVATAVAPLPLLVRSVLAAVAFVMLVFVLGGLFLLGVVDTWLDFRRRLVPDSPETPR